MRSGKFSDGTSQLCCYLFTVSLFVQRPLPSCVKRALAQFADTYRTCTLPSIPTVLYSLVCYLFVPEFACKARFACKSNSIDCSTYTPQLCKRMLRLFCSAKANVKPVADQLAQHLRRSHARGWHIRFNPYWRANLRRSIHTSAATRFPVGQFFCVFVSVLLP